VGHVAALDPRHALTGGRALRPAGRSSSPTRFAGHLLQGLGRLLRAAPRAPVRGRHRPQGEPPPGPGLNETAKREVLLDESCWPDQPTCRWQLFHSLTRYNTCRHHSSSASAAPSPTRGPRQSLRCPQPAEPSAFKKQEQGPLVWTASVDVQLGIVEPTIPLSEP
jgi:hypothetical protein